MKSIIRLAAAAALLAAPAVASAQAPTKNIVETLSGPGPFTVFAPSDAAFAKLPAGTVESLLKDKAALTAILTYHVVPGKVMAADVIKMKSAHPKTVNGQKLAIVVRDGKVFVDNAQVVTTDIVATNGVIHVIDAVLMPNKTDKK